MLRDAGPRGDSWHASGMFNHHDSWGKKKNQKDTSSGASRAAILSVGNTVRRIHREWNELQREFGKKWLSVDFDP